MNNERPKLQVKSSAECYDWLNATLGQGPLSGMFRRGGRIVHTPRVSEAGYIPPDDGDDDGPTQIQAVTPDYVVAEIQCGFECFKIVTQGAGKAAKLVPVPALFSQTAAKLAVSAPHRVEGLRPLRGVIHVPIPRKDGTLILEPGYDTETRLLYLPSPDLRVPAVAESPSDQDVAAAMELILTMIEGFPFVSEHHRVNYIGLVLTPLLREICPPPYKMFPITAPVRGSGKTLLADCARIITGGVFRTEFPSDSDELRKMITTILGSTTGPVIHIDNATGVLRSPILAGLLTSAEYSDRNLGKLENLTLTNDRVWVITGNNLNLGGDLVRRSVCVAIDAQHPDPRARTGFAITDLPGWVAEHRGELVAALLTLVRYWVVNGRPMDLSKGEDTYRNWSATVAGILSLAGFSGVFDHRDSQREQIGVDDQEWEEFAAAVYSVYQSETWAVKELLEKVSHSTTGMSLVNQEWLEAHPIPMDALPAELMDKALRSQAGLTAITKSLGRWLANRDGTFAGDFVIRKAVANSKTGCRWKVEKMDSVEQQSAVA